ncbi:DNA-3-methyladenine glycosylase family protein [Streptomyces sp. NPDC050085]|uniref:DNA-3-methyladenine glycosylase family protein n=1 Tax=Streptomyces sp. NPDC050085 TaxID=3365600 RepID=UPI00378E2542
MGLSLRPAAPFHFDGTFCKPSHFPTPHREHESGTFRQTLRWGDTVYGIRARNAGTTDAPAIDLTVFSERDLDEGEVESIAAELSRRFDLAADLRSFTELAQSDDLLGPVEQRWRGMRVGAGYSLYEFLAITCVLQNTTVRRSRDMLSALFEHYGTRVRFDGTELSAFWPASALAHDEAEQELRALKVGYRAKTLHRVACDFAQRDWDMSTLRALPRQEARDKLLGIYGVGPASIWYLLFEVLHHYDAFDTISPWEQKIYSRLLFDSELTDADKILQEVHNRWGDWRMLASHYIFEDLFWRHRQDPIDWLRDLIRL